MSLQNPAAAAAPARDPITTHVLDSTTGRPAAAVRATLTFLATTQPGEPNPTWTASTSASDGRINQWEGNIDLKEVVDKFGSFASPTSWSLTFDTGSYWGLDKTFYPEVVIRFTVQPKGGHYHVPLLLGPWGYTTYRGS